MIPSIIFKPTIEVKDGKANEVYYLKPTLINGNVHYISLNGSMAIAVDTNNMWRIQDASNR